ncbi:MAG: diiron oxygenase [Pseudonocardiaceae bacterium]
MSPFDTWYETAGVRSGVRRLFRDETDAGKVFFPARLVPYLAHEALAQATPPQQHELTVRHLYQFLMTTAHLETRIVNRCAERIANGRAGIDLAMSVRLDAFKVYCDEGYHSLYSLDLADQIAEETGIAVPPWDYGGLVDRLEQAGSRLLPDAPHLVPLLQTVVFETLITAVLNEIPPDPTVLTVVRELTRDHAQDEGRHHRFFAGFFHELWHQLDSSLREPVARALPALIHACLTWDVGPVVNSLLLAGVDPATARDITHDCYGADTGLDRIADICRATVRICQSAGVLDVPGAVEAFAAYRLFPIRPSGTEEDNQTRTTGPHNPCRPVGIARGP